jgi:uncharacterized protein
MIGGVLRARTAILIAFAAILVIAIIGATRLSIDPNNRVFFSEEHQHFERLLDLEAAFGSNTNLVYVVEGVQPLSIDWGLAESVRWLTDAVWSIGSVVAVDSVSTVPVVEEVDDELWVEDMLSHVCGPTNEVVCSTDRLSRLSDAVVANRLVDESHRVFAVIAKVDLFDPSTSNVSEIAREALGVKDRFLRQFPDYDLYLTGAVPMMQAFMDAAEHDVSSLLALAMIVLAVGLYLFLGSILVTGVLILIGFTSVVLSLGLAGFLGFTLNTATATVPLIIFTLVVASAMHLFLHLVREPRLDTPKAVTTAIIASVSANWLPVVLTAATTALGLLSLTFVASPPMHQLGLLSAFGVICGAITTLFVAPCALSLMRKIRPSRSLFAVQAVMNRYAKLLERRQPNRLWLLGLFGIALFGLTHLSVDEDFVRYFSSTSMFRADTESITRLLSGPYHIDVVYDSGGQAGAFESADIRSATRFVALLRELPDVVSVVSIYDVLQELSLAFRGTRNLDASSHDELAQYFLTYELSLSSGQTSNHLLDSDQRRARISILLGDVSMGRIRSLAQEIVQLAREGGIGDKVIITGEGIPTAYLSSESIREMSIGIALSVLFSALIVGLCFRSYLVSGTIFLATGVPLLAAFGVWGWLDSEIGMAAILVVATTIGVVIDDTIHLTYRYIDGRRSHELTNWGGAAYSVHKAGTAILINSIVLAAGLMVLSTSEFRMNSAFGFCASLVIVLALLYSLTFAPRLLAFVRVR